MNAELPLWFGRERGTDLSALIDLEDGEPAEGRGLLDDVTAGLLGLVIPLAVIALAIAAGHLPLAASIGLALAGAAWLAAGGSAAWLVSFSGEAPPWAQAMAAVLVGLGKVIGWALIVASIVLLVVVVAMLIFGMASDRR
jgi:apolipoprotein N-acyltransferase